MVLAKPEGHQAGSIADSAASGVRFTRSRDRDVRTLRVSVPSSGQRTPLSRIAPTAALTQPKVPEDGKVEAERRRCSDPLPGHVRLGYISILGPRH